MTVRNLGFMLLNRGGTNGEPIAAILVDARVIDICDLPSVQQIGASRARELSTLDILAAWRTWHPRLLSDARALRRMPGTIPARPLESVTLLAPVLYPGAIFCAGANYRDHVDEMTRALNLPQEPDPHSLGLQAWHCMKVPSSSVVGPDATVALPVYSQKVDWEAEIAIVIGETARNVPVERAFEHVAGFTIVNDLSARDSARRAALAPTSPFHFDWLGQKCFDGSLPMGPWICPIDQVDDPADMKIRLWLNDELMQDSSSKHLIFSMQEQIAHLSQRLTLRPGDIIATGTPAGVGTARGRFLGVGDSTRIAVEGIGELRTSYAR